MESLAATLHSDESLITIPVLMIENMVGKVEDDYRAILGRVQESLQKTVASSD
jgi:hypothetical protein